MRRPLAILSAALLAGIFTFGSIAAVQNNAHAAASSTPVDASSLAYVGGTIRWVNATTWTVLNDAGHADDGLNWAELMSDRVRIHFDDCHAKVGSFQVTPDEQFTSSGVHVGASVGLCYADVFFYMGGTTPVNPALLSKQYANVWVTGFFVPSAG